MTWNASTCRPTTRRGTRSSRTTARPTARSTALGRYETGGRGTGVPHLASQSSIVLSDDGAWLLVANTGSDELTLFAIGADGLEARRQGRLGRQRRRRASPSAARSSTRSTTAARRTSAASRSPDGKLDADRRLDAAAERRQRRPGADLVQPGRQDDRRHRARHERDQLLHRRRATASPRGRRRSRPRARRRTGSTSPTAR